MTKKIFHKLNFGFRFYYLSSSCFIKQFPFMIFSTNAFVVYMNSFVVVYMNSFVVVYMNSFVVYKDSFVIYRLVLCSLQNVLPTPDMVFLNCLGSYVFSDTYTFIIDSILKKIEIRIFLWKYLHCNLGVYIFCWLFRLPVWVSRLYARLSWPSSQLSILSFYTNWGHFMSIFL